MTLPGIIGAIGRLPAPAATSLDVASGTEVGGITVVLTGKYFVTGSTAVTVGGVAATSVSVLSATQVQFVTPPNAAALSSTSSSNRRDVVVTTPAGSATLTNGYTYTSEILRIAGSLYADEWRANDPAVALNAGNVLSWPSYRSGGPAFAQATGSKQPAFEAAGWNGGPSILGDGVDDGLKFAGASGYPTAKRPYAFVALQQITLGGSGMIFQMQSLTGNNECSVRDSGASKWRNARDDNSGSSAFTNSTASMDTNKHLMRMGFTTGGTATIAVDGVGVVDSVRTGATDEVLSQFGLFGDTNANSNRNMRVVGIWAFNDEPSSQQLTDLVAAIKTTIPWVGYTSSSLGLP